MVVMFRVGGVPVAPLTEGVDRGSVIAVREREEFMG